MQDVNIYIHIPTSLDFKWFVWRCSLTNLYSSIKWITSNSSFVCFTFSTASRYFNNFSVSEENSLSLYASWTSFHPLVIYLVTTASPMKRQKYFPFRIMTQVSESSVSLAGELIRRMLLTMVSFPELLASYQ